MATFTWTPATANETRQPRVRVARFGDGYEQRTGDGINNSPKSWSLTFTRPTAEADAILDFLVARNGSEAFDWTDPDGDAGRYLARNWSSELHGRWAKTVSVTFEQVFGA